jgi:predicted amidohydrolase
MVKIAVVQMPAEPCQIQTNLQLVLLYLHQAAEQGANLVVFPEGVLTGYNLSPEETQVYNVSANDQTISQIHAACSQLEVITQIGALERTADGKLYNSAFVLGPNGLQSTYRKTHLPVLGLDRFVSPGPLAPITISTPQGRLGSLICYDLRFPEPSRLLALQMAQILLVSTAWPRAASLYTDFLAQARAAENRVFLAAANRCGEERTAHFLGRSLIINPEGEILQEADGDSSAIIYAEINPADADRKHLVFNPGTYELDLFGTRRRELYDGLLQ